MKKQYSEAETKEILKKYLGPNYNHTGERAKALSSIVSYVGNASDAIALAELLPAANAFLSSSRGLALISGSLGTLSILLFPVGSMINIINAWETGHRFYAYRSVAYTVLLGYLIRLYCNLRQG